jgi:DNA replication initiation complex subunit (GINS family)
MASVEENGSAGGDARENGGNIVETLNRLLEEEEQSETLTKLPSDLYSSVALYMQKLRKSADMNIDDPLARLVRKQVWLLEGMSRQLLYTRLGKAVARLDSRDLLPEEKYVYSFYAEFERMRGKFVKAIVNGQPSIFSVLQRSQMQRMLTVRFRKPLGEVMGFDLKRYGPFRVHDVARIPAGNAEILISSGDAVVVYTRDSL